MPRNGKAGLDALGKIFPCLSSATRTEWWLETLLLWPLQPQSLIWAGFWEYANGPPTSRSVTLGRFQTFSFPYLEIRRKHFPVVVCFVFVFSDEKKNNIVVI